MIIASSRIVPLPARPRDESSPSFRKTEHLPPIVFGPINPATGGPTLEWL